MIQGGPIALYIDIVPAVRPERGGGIAIGALLSLLNAFQSDTLYTDMESRHITRSGVGHPETALVTTKGLGLGSATGIPGRATRHQAPERQTQDADPSPRPRLRARTPCRI